MYNVYLFIKECQLLLRTYTKLLKLKNLYFENGTFNFVEIQIYFLKQLTIYGNVFFLIFQIRFYSIINLPSMN